jgi:undecaprenyl-diphosphatase
MLDKLLQWDYETLIYLNNLSGAEWNSFWTTTTSITTWIPLFVFLIILLLWKRGSKKGLGMVFTILAMLLVVLLLTKISKDAVARVRPNNDEAINAFINVLKNPTDFSFFSGHAAASFSISMLVYLFLRKKTAWIGLLFVWALLFTVSRIFVGVHYPIDIIIGALVGSLIAILFYKLHNRFIKPYLG